MSNQSFKDESNWKHEPDTKHHVDDEFGKGTRTRNWKQNIDEKNEKKLSDEENKRKDREREQ